MAQANAWPTSRPVSYEAPAIVGKSNTGQSGMISGLAPWLHQATGGNPGASGTGQGYYTPVGTGKWYEGSMNSLAASQGAEVQMRKDALAAQKAQAELLRQQQMEAERNRLAPGAYFDETSGSWLMPMAGDSSDE